MWWSSTSTSLARPPGGPCNTSTSPSSMPASADACISASRRMEIDSCQARCYGRSTEWSSIISPAPQIHGMEGPAKGWRRACSRSGPVDDGHPDMHGTSWPLPRDNESSPRCLGLGGASRDRIGALEGSRLILSHSTTPCWCPFREAAVVAGTSCPVARTKPASSRATAMIVLWVPYPPRQMAVALIQARLRPSVELYHRG